MVGEYLSRNRRLCFICMERQTDIDSGIVEISNLTFYISKCLELSEII